MGRTVLIGHPFTTWREWTQDASVGYVCLDPSLADHGPAGRVYSSVAGRQETWRFVGALDPARQPIRMLSAIAELSLAHPDAIVELFAPRPNPVSRQLALAAARLLRPERILVPERSGLELWGWPVGAEPVECPPSSPGMVREAQRRSRWIEMNEDAVDHVVDLTSVSVDGARLGSGRRTDLEGWSGWAETSGGTLLIVGDESPTDLEVSRWSDHAHAQKVVHVRPEDYAGLLCGFAAQDGEDFGIGVVTGFDPADGIIRVRSTAVAPAPVRVLKLGSMKLSANGKETGEVKPWSI